MEFISAVINKKSIINDGNIRKSFDLFDLNKNNKISKEEFINLVKGNQIIEDKVWFQLIADVDKNHNNEIEFDEFKALLLKLV